MFGSDSSEDESVNLSPEEMDKRIYEAFYRSLIETVKNEDLPMEPSDF